MLTYQYKALSADGQVTTGNLQAQDHESAIEQIQNMGCIPVKVQQSVTEKKQSNNQPQLLFKKSTSFSLIEFTRDLSTLLSAGVSLEKALIMLIDLTEGNQPRDILNLILTDIRAGDPLSVSLQKQSSIFGNFYIKMIKAGEESGALNVVLVRMGNYLEQYEALKRNVQTALIYPSILMVVTLFSLLILLLFVVPQFKALFEDMGRELPLATQIVIAAGDFVGDFWWVILLLPALGIATFKHQMTKPKFQISWDTFILTLPVIGDLLVKIQVANLSRTLATLLSSGVTLIYALEIVNDTLTNKRFSLSLEATIYKVREGAFLADSLNEAGGFPRLLVHLVRVGEESGRLEKSLAQLADIYDREVNTSIQRLLAMLEPTVIIILGLLIGGIIASILVAILSVNDLAL
jgi:general secretion pathway protein F